MKPEGRDCPTCKHRAELEPIHGALWDLLLSLKCDHGPEDPAPRKREPRPGHLRLVEKMGFETAQDAEPAECLDQRVCW